MFIYSYGVKDDIKKDLKLFVEHKKTVKVLNNNNSFILHVCKLLFRPAVYVL